MLPFSAIDEALRAATNESQKTRNKKQNGLAHLRFLVCVTPKQKKILLDSSIKFLAKHVWNSQSTIYLKSHGCVHGLQNEMSLIHFSTMFCYPEIGHFEMQNRLDTYLFDSQNTV